MAVPEVNTKLLGELEAMGFSLVRAIRALHSSGNTSLEAAVNWVIDHENDTDIDQFPLVPVDIEIESPKSSTVTEEIKLRAQELRNQAREKEEKKMEREIEKAQRRRKFGIPVENLAAIKPPTSVLQENKPFPLKSPTMAERMGECLRCLKRNYMNELRLSELEVVAVGRDEFKYTAQTSSIKLSLEVRISMDLILTISVKDDDARVTRAFRTLLIYVENVAKNPNEEKFRKIRFSNPTFQNRVGSLKGGIEFLELCGFERVEGGEFLYLPGYKVDLAILNSAGSELKSAITNPFFGLLSK